MAVLRKSDYGPKPELQWLPTGKLSVDAKYQRDTGSRRSQNLIEKIRATFTWSRFVVVLVVKYDEGWRVIDGQHRVEACRALGIGKIPAVVLPHASVEAAAADFVAINRDRVVVTPLHLHHAQLAAGDEEAKAIARACKAAGVDICRYPVPARNMKPGQTLAVGTIARIVRLHGESFAADVLRSVRTAKGGDLPGAVNAIAIRDEANRLELRRPTKPVGGGERQRRACLSCGTPFLSEGKHNRLCGGCKSRSAA